MEILQVDTEHSLHISMREAVHLPNPKTFCVSHLHGGLGDALGWDTDRKVKEKMVGRDSFSHKVLSLCRTWEKHL